MTLFPFYTFIKCEEIVIKHFNWRNFLFFNSKRYWERNNERKKKRNIRSYWSRFSFHYWWKYSEEIESIIFIIFHILCEKNKSSSPRWCNVIQSCKFFLRYIFLFSFDSLFNRSYVYSFLIFFLMMFTDHYTFGEFPNAPNRNLFFASWNYIKETFFSIKSYL